MPTRSPRTWATAQGVATLPLALAGLAVLIGRERRDRSHDSRCRSGPHRCASSTLMLAIGLFASWLGTLCWNEASQRLPTALAGQLIVFETLAALAYAFALRGEWPAGTTLAGIALLVIGVAWALSVRPEPIAIAPH